MEAAGTSSKKMIWTGRVISALLVLFLLFDAAIKLMKIAPVIDAFKQLGWPTTLAVPIGIVLLACAVIYAIPSTSILGAILLTGYLGGRNRHALASWPTILFSTYFWCACMGRALLARCARACADSFPPVSRAQGNGFCFCTS